MKIFKATVKSFVFAFILFAGYLTFAGLDPQAKEAAESVFNEDKKSYPEKNLATIKEPVFSVETTG
ncbi:MAG: hypothetical protein GY727_13265 [Gammaproteobacteria bacterium]|nr:hypothetical protein [Gammaproteobacteria bacterium]MCP4088254.1 hypothetical protein [Gammaproteobacteria bacterium]MCP4276435.1 hypothetical protein [Gammaproteobacteria bacterium]MCP4831082.1 hypothetical protein [Gammaproteobacteria bacterium]MCP4929350.1 hypothetical protein [Gammaproteobacteria bacterium]